MQVRLLGHVEVIPDDGHTLPLVLGGPTQRRLLALLALRRNEAVPVSRLTEAVWPSGELPARADHNVRTYVHRLRTALEGCSDRLETSGAGYRLRLEAGELDAAEFDGLVAAARRLADMGETTAALDVIADAEGLWRGEPLAEFEEELWAVPHAVRLRHLHSELRTLKAAVLIDCGRAGSAIGLLEGLIREGPFQERPRALLMRALHRAGRQVEALRVFRDFRRMLIEETGIEPSAELAELDRQVLMNELSDSAYAIPRIVGYTIHERIGEGELTAVYRATQAVLDRPVAIRIIKAESANRAGFIRRFEAGAQVIARIEHPGIVPLYDYWREPDQAFLVMRWMAGGSLPVRLGDLSWSVEAVVALVDHIAAALDVAHRMGVVHGYVRPENVFFDADGRPHLGGFGLALLDESVPHPSVPAENLKSSASPGMRSGEAPGPETDVSGLASVAFALLTGRTPTVGSEPPPAPLPPVTEARPELPAAVDEVLRIASASAPNDRYPSATAMAAAFRAACLAAPRPTAVVPTRSNPYKGLRPFDEADATDFHGRWQLIDELLTLLASRDTRMLVVVGPSGSGKSSIVRAGLVPALRSGRIPGSERWFMTMMTPGSRPYEALEAALLKVAVNPPASLMDQLRDGERGVARAVKRILPTDQSAVIVIDQFEELFSGAVRESEADQFLRALVALVADPEAGTRLVLTLRADFYDRPLRHPVFAPELKRSTVAVTPLAPDELERAIVDPAAAVGVGFEPGLVAEIVAEVTREPGGLPLLQYALTRAFDATDGDLITFDVFRGVGGLAGALTQVAEQTWRAADHQERHAIRRLFGRLITLGEGTEDTRRRVPIAELEDTLPTRRMIEQFTRARLLTLDRHPTTREPTVEMAHEAIIREWPRLRAWLDEDRDELRAHRHLTATAEAWLERKRDPGELYRGSRLEVAEGLLESPKVTLNTSEAEFLRASLQHREQERVEERSRLVRLRRSVAITTVVALIAVAAGFGAIVQGRQAQAASREAETGRIVATVQSLADAKPRVALLLALAAYQREHSPRTLGALMTALGATGPELQYLGSGSDYLDVEWPAEGLVVGVREAGLDLFDLSNGQVIDSVEMNIGTGIDKPGSVTRALDRTQSRAASGGGVLAVATTGREVVVFAVDGRFEEVFRSAMPADATAVDVSPDGGYIVATSADGTVAAWSRRGESLFTPLRFDLAPNLTEQFTAASDLPILFPDWFDVDPLWIRPIAHEDHVHLAAGSEMSTIRYDGRPVDAPLTTAFGPPIGMVPQQLLDVFHSSSSTLLVGTSSVGYASDADLVSLSMVQDTFGSAGAWMSAVFMEPDGQLTAVLEDGTVVELDVRTGEVSPVYQLRVDPVRSGTVSPTFDRMAVATAEGIVIAALDGRGALHTTLPRDDLQRTVAISKNGDFIVLGPNGFTASLSVYALTEAGYQSVQLVDEAANIWLRPPHYLWMAEMDGLRLADYEVSQYRLDGAMPELIGTGRRSVGVIYDTDPQERFAVAGEAFDPHLAVLESETMVDLTKLALPPGIEIAVHLGGVRFDPEGFRLLVSSRFGQAEMWDTGTWERIGDPDLTEYDIASGFWSDDGSMVATASSDGQVTIRDGETFRPIRRMIGAARPVGPYRSGPMIFSENGAFLLTNHDNVIRLWDVKTGEQIGTDITTLEGTVSGIGGGSVLHGITAEENHALIWNLDLETWPELACQVAGSNLTRSEWEQWGPVDEDYRAICARYPVDG
jgi:DNA-binding SARP family transcriptional activator/WD40 repeat protein